MQEHFFVVAFPLSYDLVEQSINSQVSFTQSLPSLAVELGRRARQVVKHFPHKLPLIEVPLMQKALVPQQLGFDWV